MPQTLSAALVIAILVSLAKPFVDSWLPKTSSLHDGAIRLVAVLLGVAGQVIQTAVAGTLTAQSAWNAAGQGLLAAVTAIASYHLVTGSFFSVTSLPAATIVLPELPAAPTLPASGATPAAQAPSKIEQIAAAGPAFPPAQ